MAAAVLTALVAHPKCLHRPPTAPAAVLLSLDHAPLQELLGVPPSQLQQTEVSPAQVLPLVPQDPALAQHWVMGGPTAQPQAMLRLQLPPAVLVPLLLLLVLQG